MGAGDLHVPILTLWPHRNNPQLVNQRPEEERTSTSSILLSVSQDTKTDPQCCYCLQSHLSVSCTYVTITADRRHVQLIKTSGQCFNCLRQSHVSWSCKSTSRCQMCKKKHHISICDAGLNPPVASSQQVLNPIAFQLQTINTLCSASVPTVLIQTTCFMIHHPSNHNILLQVWLILDAGSQQFHLSEQAHRLLKSELTQEQSLSIVTFGSGKRRVKVYPVVTVGMHLRGHSSMSLTLYFM